MKPLTDTGLSRVLSEHAAGNMIRNGGAGWADCIIDDSAEYPHGCLEQVRLNCPDDVDLKNEDLPRGFDADNSNWFDNNYQCTWTEEQFLEALEKEKIA